MGVGVNVGVAVGWQSPSVSIGGPTPVQSAYATLAWLTTGMRLAAAPVATASPTKSQVPAVLARLTCFTGFMDMLLVGYPSRTCEGPCSNRAHPRAGIVAAVLLEESGSIWLELPGVSAGDYRPAARIPIVRVDPGGLRKCCAQKTHALCMACR